MVNVNSLGNGGAVHQRRKAIKSAAKGKQHGTAVQTAIFKLYINSNFVQTSLKRWGIDYIRVTMCELMWSMRCAYLARLTVWWDMFSICIECDRFLWIVDILDWLCKSILVYESWWWKFFLNNVPGCVLNRNEYWYLSMLDRIQKIIEAINFERNLFLQCNTIPIVTFVS